MDIKLPKIVKKSKKRKGRGYGSGKGGHTATRGQKGQKSRRNLGIMFEGVKTKKSFVKRLPLLRGKGKFKPHPQPVEIKLEELDVFRSGSKVDIDSLIEKDVVDEKKARSAGVKVIGGGDISKKLKVTVPTTSSVEEKIKKAGGEIISE